MKKIPVVMMLFMSIFGFIGLTILIALWSGAIIGFESGPFFFFKLFASFIAVAFMIMGFGVPLTALMQRTSTSGDTDQPPPTLPNPEPSVGYKCPHCGAGIDKQEVSPGGDVKCSYCKKWYNIHRPAG